MATIEVSEFVAKKLEEFMRDGKSADSVIRYMINHQNTCRLNLYPHYNRSIFLQHTENRFIDLLPKYCSTDRFLHFLLDMYQVGDHCLKMDPPSIRGMGFIIHLELMDFSLAKFLHCKDVLQDFEEYFGKKIDTAEDVIIVLEKVVEEWISWFKEKNL